MNQFLNPPMALYWRWWLLDVLNAADRGEMTVYASRIDGCLLPWRP